MEQVRVSSCPMSNAVVDALSGKSVVNTRTSCPRPATPSIWFAMNVCDRTGNDPTKYAIFTTLLTQGEQRQHTTKDNIQPAMALPVFRVDAVTQRVGYGQESLA
jgi:hypothetical protein